MEYFQLCQDERISTVPRLKNVYQNIDKRNITRDRYQNMEEVVFFDVETSELTLFTDVIDRDLYMLSHMIRGVFSMYDPELPFIHIVLKQTKHTPLENYYLPVLEEFDCLSRETEFNLDKSQIHRIVICEKNLPCIFRVKYSGKPIVIVRLDVAESIFRRKPKGIRLKHIALSS